MTISPAGHAIARTSDGLSGLTERVAVVTLSVAGVTGLSAGTFGEVATYLPGKRIPGIRIRDGRVDVHVDVRMGLSLPLVASAVRAAVEPLVLIPVDVIVEDVTLPEVSSPDGL